MDGAGDENSLRLLLRNDASMPTFSHYINVISWRTAQRTSENEYYEHINWLYIEGHCFVDASLCV